MTTAMKPELYANTPAVGLLKGFSPVPHQLEVDVIVPHQERGLPGVGEFMLVELSAGEAMVGRVSRYHAAGQLATERGDAYLGDLAKTEDAVPSEPRFIGQSTWMSRMGSNLNLAGMRVLTIST
jgi:hypothetical protein